MNYPEAPDSICHVRRYGEGGAACAWPAGGCCASRVSKSFRGHRGQPDAENAERSPKPRNSHPSANPGAWDSNRGPLNNRLKHYHWAKHQLERGPGAAARAGGHLLPIGVERHAQEGK